MESCLSFYWEITSAPQVKSYDISSMLIRKENIPKHKICCYLAYYIYIYIYLCVCCICKHATFIFHLFFNHLSYYHHLVSIVSHPLLTFLPWYSHLKALGWSIVAKLCMNDLWIWKILFNVKYLSDRMKIWLP
jgi:hypothetical protein